MNTQGTFVPALDLRPFIAALLCLPLLATVTLSTIAFHHDGTRPVQAPARTQVRYR